MKHPMQPIELAKDGAIRFKSNAIVNCLLEQTKKYNFTLNDLAIMDFSQEDWEQFYQLIGYSIGGYCDLSTPSDKSKDVAWKKMNKILNQNE